MTDDADGDRGPGAPEGNSNAVGNDGGNGGPPGNSHALGNEGGGAPPANQNAATHHLHADPDNVLAYLEENEPEAFEWVAGKYDSYLESAPFDPGTARADKLLETVVCEYSIWRARGIQVRDGIVTKTHVKDSDGEVYEVEDERPENQAVNRMDRQVMSKLDKLGVLDDDNPDPDAENMSNEYYSIEFVDADQDGDDAEEESADGE